ncbi:MAG: response regulator [Patescibacteria group bacterium]
MNPTLTFSKKEKPQDVKVMIVDDDHFILNMYRIKFEHCGFDLKLASNGQEALDIARGGYVPDVLFIDVIMPVMGGIEFLETIRKEKLFEHVPVVVLTNQSQAHDIDVARKLGIHSYIVKATTVPSDIVEEVNKMFNLS